MAFTSNCFVPGIGSLKDTPSQAFLSWRKELEKMRRGCTESFSAVKSQRLPNLRGRVASRVLEPLSCKPFEAAEAATAIAKFVACSLSVSNLTAL